MWYLFSIHWICKYTYLNFCISLILVSILLYCISGINIGQIGSSYAIFILANVSPKAQCVSNKEYSSLAISKLLIESLHLPAKNIN